MVQRVRADDLPDLDLRFGSAADRSPSVQTIGEQGADGNVLLKEQDQLKQGDKVGVHCGQDWRNESVGCGAAIIRFDRGFRLRVGCLCGLEVSGFTKLWVSSGKPSGGMYETVILPVCAALEANAVYAAPKTKRAGPETGRATDDCVGKRWDQKLLRASHDGLRGAAFLPGGL